MNNNLLATLVERNLINENTVVKAHVPAQGFHLAWYEAVENIHWHPGIVAEKIIDIEGMDPERFAKSYNIKPDGNVTTYKKRGRKAKQLA